MAESRPPSRVHRPRQRSRSTRPPLRPSSTESSVVTPNIETAASHSGRRGVEAAAAIESTVTRTWRPHVGSGQKIVITPVGSINTRPGAQESTYNTLPVDTLEPCTLLFRTARIVASAIRRLPLYPSRGDDPGCDSYSRSPRSNRQAIGDATQRTAQQPGNPVCLTRHEAPNRLAFANRRHNGQQSRPRQPHSLIELASGLDA